jgi:uncharacterized Zn ribbon protein
MSVICPKCKKEWPWDKQFCFYCDMEPKEFTLKDGTKIVIMAVKPDDNKH